MSTFNRRSPAFHISTTFKQKLTRSLLMAATGMMLSLSAAVATADEYPSRPIRLVVPFTAGGGTDVTSRLVAEQLGRKLGQSLIIDNRPGASGAIGAGAVAREKPDGYTLLVGTAALAASSVVEGMKTPFDLLKDFEFIGKLGKIDLVVVVRGQSSIRNLQDLVNLMKTQPGKVQFGSPGIGAPAHLGGELFRLVTKSSALHVPYKGESAALNDLLGGQITFQLCAPLICGPRIKDGSLRALAVTAKERSKALPDVPTMAEAGVPGVEVGTWYYLAAPKGTPAEVVKKVNAALNDVLADEQLRARLLAAGVEAAKRTTPAEVKQGLEAEMAKWRPVVKMANITN
ncbi:tripartite tricarboxylate transporter substrate binding protein [Cupriavidus sp. P-10]|uniref:Bug family tripartite tricarboxylate transporter substrate binding protein n=1 Tax=Cupriavidus sp. P-10 TaxID=2027911 RepID=UPI000EC001E0|nr:tripartite tricarboxylate transporter substrate binding protein [Cupriavidus sp. P-10]BDB27853.1 tripartite tricarboxylate transporter substrate binding protein [Cupriavidus sp. P-10]